MSGLLSMAPAWAVSMLVHIIVLLSMALVVNEVPKPEAPRMIIASAPEVEENFEEFEEEALVDQAVIQDAEVAENMTLPVDGEVRDVEVVTAADDIFAAQTSVELADFSPDAAAGEDLMSTVGTKGGTAGGFGGRTSATVRAEMIRSGAGNSMDARAREILEQRVEDSITYVWNHQLADGGWSFDCAKNPNCNGQCDNPKHANHLNDRVAATALAIWPAVMTGYTHEPSKEKKQRTKAEKDREEAIRIRVDNGLAFLARNVIEGNGKAFHKGGNMYSQALTAAVLSEAYGATQDPRLALPAQLALNFIMQSQDPSGGGWRYQPRQPGDTSSVAWQLGALRSGQLAYLKVPPIVLNKASFYLDSVASDDGAAYGYDNPASARPAMTAAGLLSRIFTGWKRQDAILRGAQKIAKQGPNSDIYYTYYGTQLLFYLRGEMPAEWAAWQTKMTDLMNKAQVTDGHQKGSYFKGFESGHAPAVGGRLYVTSMATMTLEVYFSKGALFGKEQKADDFVE